MAIKKKSGHAVTSVLPSGADAAQVTPAHPKFQPAVTQNGGMGNGAPARGNGKGKPSYSK